MGICTLAVLHQDLYINYALQIEEKIHFQDITAGLTFHDNFHIHLKIEAYV